MTKLDDALTQHRRHMAHLLEAADWPCPCGVCVRARFEAAVTFVVLGCMGAVSLVALAVWLAVVK